MSIRVLEDAVVDRIAAGEVVERPASVVKELVENSLDAGATRLEVRLKDGGAARVSVTDDGKGMGEDDALLCLERHATSKIRTAADLVGVTTLGFRGEAVPSIASVSRFTLRTRRAEDDLGTEVKVDGGRLEHVGPVARTPGTEVTVRSLFHHVPARRRFLRTRQTELAHCVEQVQRQLLVRPDVAVTLRHDGRDVLVSAATDDPRRRIQDILDVPAERLLTVDHTAHGVRVTGFVAPPDVSRSTAAGAVYTYVHRRFVRDRVVRRAVTDAVRPLLPQGRHPLLVIDVEVPAGEVDVNVHPAKTEVRFRSPRQVMQAITAALREALDAPAPAPTRGVLDRSPPGQLSLGPSPMPPEALLARPPAAEPVRSASPTWHDGDDVVPPAPVVAEAPPAADAGPPAPDVAPSPEPTPAPPRHALLRLHWLALHPPVGIARLDDDLVVVDLAEARRRGDAHRLATTSPTAQPLLAPQRVSPGPVRTQALLDGAEALSAVGVEISAFGPGTLAVMALPAGVPVDDPAALLEALADALRAGSPLAPVVAAASDTAPGSPHAAARLMATLVDDDLPTDDLWRRLDAAALRDLVRGG